MRRKAVMRSFSCGCSRDGDITQNRYFYCLMSDNMYEVAVFFDNHLSLASSERASELVLPLRQSRTGLLKRPFVFDVLQRAPDIVFACP